MSLSNTKEFKLQDLLETPYLSRTRRNHGLEHATLHVLSEKFPHKSLAGHSDMKGFWLLGDIPTEDVQAAVKEALNRLKGGENNLAVHPNCGTNFAVAGFLVALASMFGFWGAGRRWQDKLERLPFAATLATITLILAQPLGLKVQQHITTSGNPGDLSIEEIIPTTKGGLKAHRIITRG